MSALIIHGQPQSTYVRTARMACIEAGVSYELRAIADGPPDVVMAALRSDDHARLHPFHRMPAMSDGEQIIFETSAICRHVSMGYGNDCLVPGDPREAIRMEQWVSALNCYVIPDVVRGFVFPLIFDPSPDMNAIDAAKPGLRKHFATLDAALADRVTLAGDGEGVTIADLLLAPLAQVVGALPGGMDLYEGLENLGNWWEHVSKRESFTSTHAPLPGTADEAA